MTACINKINTDVKWACTCALGLVRPIPAVVLSVALPPRRDAASVPALVLKVARAAGHLGGRRCTGSERSTRVHISNMYTCLFNMGTCT